MSRSNDDVTMCSATKSLPEHHFGTAMRAALVLAAAAALALAGPSYPANVLQYMNLSADPCNDFYGMAPFCDQRNWDNRLAVCWTIGMYPWMFPGEYPICF